MTMHPAAQSDANGTAPPHIDEPGRLPLGAKYDAFYGGPHTEHPHPDVAVVGWPRSRIEAIVAEPLQGDVLLDIGCGDGFLLYQFRRRFQQLIGLEYSAHRLQGARRRLAGLPFTGVHGSAESMTVIPDGTIDAIVSADVIEHVPDVYAAADEMHRVLRPGGRLVINTPNVAFLVKRMRLLAGRFPSTSQGNEGLGSDVLFDGGHLHYFTYRSLGLLLERSGFRIVRRIGYGPHGRIHNLWPNLLSVGVQLVAEKPADSSGR
jgi:SAM-dependent methyltransferase